MIARQEADLARLRHRGAVVERQAPELARLPTPGQSAPSATGPVDRAETKGRRTALRRLLLGAGAAAAGLLATAREPRAAHANAEGQFLTNANGQFGLLAYPNNLGLPTTNFGSANLGVVGTVGSGLFIASTDARGFEVRELGGGTSGVEFGYRVVGKRKDMQSGHRLGTVTAPDLSKLKLPVPAVPERSGPELAPGVEPSAPTPRRTPSR